HLRPPPRSTLFPYTTLFRSSPSVAPDGTIYVGSENRNLYAINPADGSIKWTYTADNDIYTVPAIDAAGNLYFSVLNNGKLFSLRSEEHTSELQSQSNLVCRL